MDLFRTERGGCYASLLSAPAPRPGPGSVSSPGRGAAARIPLSAEGEGVGRQAGGEPDGDGAGLGGVPGGDGVDVGGAGDADDLAGAAGRDSERAGAADVEVDVRGVEAERDPGALARGDRLLADGPGAGEGEGVRGEGGGRRELAGRVGGAAVVPLLAFGAEIGLRCLRGVLGGGVGDVSGPRQGDPGMRRAQQLADELLLAAVVAFPDGDVPDLAAGVD